MISSRSQASGLIVKIERAMVDPAAAFGSPRDVVRDSRLRKHEKIEILSRWAYDSAELSVAEEEGMDGGEATDMSEILKALDEIAIVDVQHCAPTKHAAFHVMPPERRPRSLPRSAGVVPA
ncbi:MAG TPA: hypothetical protein VGN43_01985 [Steroidobacteraceae bacterium]|nr:hypothetical protein [Steroidobacteraceae bacterium]